MFCDSTRLSLNWGVSIVVNYCLVRLHIMYNNIMYIIHSIVLSLFNKYLWKPLSLNMDVFLVSFYLH